MVRKKTCGNLNGSISTYGKVRARLLNDVPNVKWLPSDDSLPTGIANGPKILANITNRKRDVADTLFADTKPRRATACLFDSESDDDFKPSKPSTRKFRKCVHKSSSPIDKGKKVSDKTKRKRSRKIYCDSGKENASPGAKRITRAKKKITDRNVKKSERTSCNGKTAQLCTEMGSTLPKAAPRSADAKKSVKPTSGNKETIQFCTEMGATLPKAGLRSGKPSSDSGHFKASPVLPTGKKNIENIDQGILSKQAHLTAEIERYDETSVIPLLPAGTLKTSDADAGDSKTEKSSSSRNPQLFYEIMSNPNSTIDIRDATEISSIMPPPTTTEFASIQLQVDINHHCNDPDNSLKMKGKDLQNLSTPMPSQATGMSFDLFSPPSRIASQIIDTSILTREPKESKDVLSGNAHCSAQISLKSPRNCNSFNVTVVGHAINFENIESGSLAPRADVSSILIPAKSILPSSAAGIVQSTPQGDIRLRPRRHKQLTRSPAIPMSIPVQGSDKQISPKKEMAANKRPRVGRVPKRSRFRKPKPLNKRLLKKYNKSINNSKNASMLQQIMIGGPLNLQHQYDFIEDSNDAYFLGGEMDINLGSKNPAQNQTRKMQRVPNKPKNKRRQKAQIVKSPVDQSCDEASIVSSSIPRRTKRLISRVSPKSKCLRKKRRIDYKLMMSGSFQEGDRSKVMKTEQENLKDGKQSGAKHEKKNTANNGSLENLERLRWHIKEGNVNPRRKQLTCKLKSSPSFVFSPLNLKCISRIDPDSMPSPGFAIPASTPVADRSARIHSRSPGSHLRTPRRVHSRIHEFRSNSSGTDSPLKKLCEKSPCIKLPASLVPAVRLERLSTLRQSVRTENSIEPLHQRSVCNDFTDREKVLNECNQSEPLSFADALSRIDFQKCSKLGEGVFGEVFGSKMADTSEKIAIKVIPIEGDLVVNEERQKTFQEILPEILSSKELCQLSSNDEHATDGFIKLHQVRCVKGEYPEFLLQAWDSYDAERCSENDRPDKFDGDQLYILLLYSDGGTDVEHYKFRSANQAFSAVQQVCAALAVAEKTLEFEHRDLHWGNILITPTRSKTVNATVDGRSFRIQTHGIKVSIIDFTLSRLTKDGVIAFQDLSSDPDIFIGDADVDYQFEVYRMMKILTCDDWSEFCPKSNVFWLHYLLKKICESRKI